MRLSENPNWKNGKNEKKSMELQTWQGRINKKNNNNWKVNNQARHRRLLPAVPCPKLMPGLEILKE
jgi:hypothetical protein